MLHVGMMFSGSWAVLGFHQTVWLHQIGETFQKSCWFSNIGFQMFFLLLVLASPSWASSRATSVPVLANANLLYHVKYLNFGFIRSEKLPHILADFPILDSRCFLMLFWAFTIWASALSLPCSYRATSFPVPANANRFYIIIQPPPCFTLEMAPGWCWISTRSSTMWPKPKFFRSENLFHMLTDSPKPAFRCFFVVVFGFSQLSLGSLSPAPLKLPVPQFLLIQPPPCFTLEMFLRLMLEFLQT